MLRASTAITLLTLIVSAIGFFNQVLIARDFGASAAVDAYLIAIGLPTLVMGIFSTMLNYSLIPALILQRADVGSYSGFLKVSLLMTVALALTFAVVGMVAAPQYVRVFGKQLPPSALDIAIVINRIAWANSCLMIVVGYLTSVSNAEKRFIVPTTAALLPPAFSVLFILAASNFGVVVVPLGMGFGSLIGLLLLAYAIRDLIWRNAKRDICREDVMRVLRFIGRSPLVLVAMGCFSAYAVIDVILTSRLGVGDLSYLGYAQRLLIATGNFIIVGLFTVLGPQLAETWANDQRRQYFEDISYALRSIITLGAPVVLFISFFAEPVTALLFERGSFDSSATKGVAQLLPTMLIGMIAMLGVTILFRALFARGDYRWPAVLGGSWVLLYFALGAWFSELAGVRGIGIAYSLSWWLVFLAALYATYGSFELRANLRGTIFFLIKILTALTAAGFVITVLGDYFVISQSDRGSGPPLLLLTATFLAEMVTYWVLVRMVLSAGRKKHKLPRVLPTSRIWRK